MLKNYNLEERTARFGEAVIRFVKRIPQDAINKRLISQIVASAGSVGANYCEANEGESKKDFTHKISICKKEVKETKHWLRMLASSNPECKNDLRILYKEAHELLLIFAKIIRSSHVLKIS